MPGYDYGSKPAAQPDPYGATPVPPNYRMGTGRAPKVSGERAQYHQCPDCARFFSTEFALRGHQRSHQK